MNGRKSLELLVGLVLIALLLSACGPSAPPETRAGEWKATADFGEFTFTVDPSGTGITKIVLDYESCSSAIVSGGVFISQAVGLEPTLPIEDSTFTLEMEAVSVEIQGKFSRDGSRASGSWTAGECSGRWEATKSP
jgi:hypothetical protein